ncbi:hypothetical protein A2801_02230 [Candidatus Woesebacteria bacterium RIFCSPHIGHO2_01_FULL_41_10]|uniref:PEGA domain-containing protein n=1 Tax=Candidatus Woesebacteria bacterium RIFCSPHIGHO2_01_FULL_41_10 TaxID=1802500 RepID=A0A1F7YRN4_9BACT|nr:MAG: hypothetical protein A2801_02230 [Candidatus Woesebacteria bacterium RIFCSPHIGHO2_01_FULL_41_10]
MIQLVLVGGVCALIFTIIIGKDVFSRSAVFIETDPITKVYIDGVLAGSSPIEIERKSGKVRLELVVESQNTDGHSPSYTTILELRPGVKTIVRRKFRGSSGASAGAIISFEQLMTKVASIEFITIPDKASIYVDGKFTGISPLITDSLSEGTHGVEIVAEDRYGTAFEVQAISGHLTTIYAELEKVENTDDSQSDSDTAVENPDNQDKPQEP